MRQIKSINFKQTPSKDLRVNFCGSEICEPLHSYGPAVRDYYIIHYILRGKGILKVKDKKYDLGKGQGFMIGPGVLHSYIADNIEPWHYSWIAFNGELASYFIELAGLSAENPVFGYKRDELLYDLFDQMINSQEMKAGRELKVLGLLQILISELVNLSEIKPDMNRDVKLKEILYERTLEFISINYSREISIQDICGHLGISRTYLFMIFKEYLGISPQGFLINYRINKAVDLMRIENLSIADVARSVGYEDPLQFSKMFKKVKGQSPKEFRSTLM